MLLVNIDVDSLDGAFIQSLPIIPNDQTSNPAWLFMQLQDPTTNDVVTQLIQEDNELRRSRNTRVLLARLVCLGLFRTQLRK